MNLREQISHDLKESAKAKDQMRLSTLRLLSAAIKNREVEKRTKLSKAESSTEKLEEQSKLSDEEILSVISSELKKRREAAEQYRQGKREELAEKEEAELKTLSVYMPAQLSEDELRKIVKETIKETGVTSVQEMGKLMGALMPKIRGKADGSLVNKIIKEELGK